MRPCLLPVVLLSSCVIVGHPEPDDGPTVGDGPGVGGGGGEPHGGDGGADGPSGDGGPTTDPVSDFGAGGFAAVSLVLLPPDVGRDFDGDGAADNGLAEALATLGDLLGTDEVVWDPQAELDRLVQEGHLVPLFAAAQRQEVLTVQGLTGTRAEDGALRVLAESYGEDGAPLWWMTGAFVDAELFEVGAERVDFAARLDAEGAVLRLPIARAGMTGLLDEAGATVTLTGVVPAEAAVDLFLAPYLGEEGLDLDGDGVADLPTEEVLDLASRLAADPRFADVPLGEGGARGVSLSFGLVLEPARF